MAQFEGDMNLNVETSEIEIKGKFKLTEEELDKIAGGQGPIGEPGGPSGGGDHQIFQEWWKPVQLTDSCGNWGYRASYVHLADVVFLIPEDKRLCSNCKYLEFEQLSSTYYCTFPS